MKTIAKLILAVMLAMLPLAVVSLVSAQTPTGNATVASPISSDTQNLILTWLTAAAIKFPVITTLIGIMGTMRLWAKPVFSALHAIVDLTPSKADDGWLNSVTTFFNENSVGRFLAYLVDWLTSVKIIPPAKADPQSKLPLS